MAAPCTEHLFLTGRKGVGKSTLLRALLGGKRLGGFFTRRVTGVFDRPSIHLLQAAEDEQPSPANLVCFCGERRPERFDLLGPAALADTAGCDIVVMDELGPSEAAAQGFQAAVLAALDGSTPVLAAVKPKDTDFLRRVRQHPHGEVFNITPESREALYQHLRSRILQWNKEEL